jgi:hypothetical protein
MRAQILMGVQSGVCRKDLIFLLVILSITAEFEDIYKEGNAMF